MKVFELKTDKKSCSMTAEVFQTMTSLNRVYCLISSVQFLKLIGSVFELPQLRLFKFYAVFVHENITGRDADKCNLCRVIGISNSFSFPQIYKIEKNCN